MEKLARLFALYTFALEMLDEYHEERAAFEAALDYFLACNPDLTEYEVRGDLCALLPVY